MKLVVSSDWHPDHVTHGVSRFDDVAKAVVHTVDVAIREKADGYLFAGDLCDPDAGSVVLRCVELAIEAAVELAGHDIPSIWIAGNHDVVEDGLGTTTLSPLRGLGINSVIVCEQPQMVHIEGLAVVALPFTAATNPYDPEDALRRTIAPDSPVLVAGHLCVPGVVPGEETTDMPRGREVAFPLAVARERFPRATLLNGHYHRRQTTPEGVIIPGSLVRLTFNEEQNEPCFLVLEIS